MPTRNKTPADGLYDKDIRHFIIGRIAKNHTTNQIVIEEMPTGTKKCRVDIAVIGKRMKAIEIKGTFDSLSRLKNQIENYSYCFDEIDIYFTPNHLGKILSIVPDYCGLHLVSINREATKSKCIRKSTTIKMQTKEELLSLLWKEEMRYIAIRHGIIDKKDRLDIASLYFLINENLSLGIAKREVVNTIRERLISAER